MPVKEISVLGIAAKELESRTGQSLCLLDCIPRAAEFLNIGNLLFVMVTAESANAIE